MAGIEHHILQLIAHYGYVALFIALVLGIVGLPVPDDVLMLFAGFIVSKGQLNYLTTVLVSITGSLSGMSISYLIGSKFGYPLLHKYGPKIHISRKRLERVERWFVKYGKAVLVFGYFIPGVRHLTAYLCGIGKWKYHNFLHYAVYGATMWVLTFVTTGYYLEEKWKRYYQMFRHYLRWPLLIFVVIVAAAVLYILIWRKKNPDEQ